MNLQNKKSAVGIEGRYLKAIEKLNGKLSLTSEPGKGTELEFVSPNNKEENDSGKAKHIESCISN